MFEPHYPVADVAKMLHRGQRRIREMIRDGALDAVQPPSASERGGHYLVPESAIKKILKPVRAQKRK